MPCARKVQLFFFLKVPRKNPHYDSIKKLSENDIINMPVFMIDNIHVMFGGLVLQQTVGIPMGSNCPPLLATCYFIRMRQTSYRGC